VRFISVLSQRVPILVALVAQAVAFLLLNVLLGSGLFPWLVGYGLLIAHGVIAAALGRIAGLAWWWIPILLIAPSAVHAAATHHPPPWLYGALFIAGLLVFGGGIISRVPLYLWNQAAAEALAGLLADQPTPRAVDLGAGFGGPMRHLGRRFPAGSFRNVEASPLTVAIAGILALRQRNVRTRWRDLFAEPLADADLAYAFLSAAPMPRLWAKVCSEMRPGTWFVSNTFPVVDVQPERIIDLPGRDDARLYCYRIPAR
jgi:hypothetical protein